MHCRAGQDTLGPDLKLFDNKTCPASMIKESLNVQSNP
jgi:hypothetical protein